MQYVLGFALEYKKYKKSANIRIFANDHLIDDIHLTDDIITKSIQTKEIRIGPAWVLYEKTKKSEEIDYNKFEFGQQVNAPGEQFPDKVEVPKKLFCYLVDESVLRNEIRIEVVNSDSNNSNGFMTKWAWIKFYNVFLIPKDYLNFEKLNEITKKSKDYLQEHPEHPTFGFRLHWPTPKQSVEGKELVPWNNWQTLEKGGSFKLQFPIMGFKNNEIDEKFKMLAPENWTRLSRRDERLVVISEELPFYCQHFDLINTLNEDN